MKKTKALVLGAGLYQHKLIETLKNNNYHITAVSNRKAESFNPLIDEFLWADVADAASIEKHIDLTLIDLVVSSASERALESWAYLTQKAGINGPDLLFTNWLKDKRNWKKKLSESGIDIPLFYTDEHTTSFSEKYLVKPIAGSGSNGIHWLYPNQSWDVEKYFVEQFIEGQEYGGDFVISQGELAFCRPTLKICDQNWIPLVHMAFDKPILIQRIKQYLRLCAKALSLPDGIYNFDLINDPNDQLKLLDLGYRMGGNGVPEISFHQDGFDETEWTLSWLTHSKTEISLHAADNLFGVFCIRNPESEKYQLNLNWCEFIRNQIYTVKLELATAVMDTEYNSEIKNAAYLVFKAQSFEELNNIAAHLLQQSEWMILK